MYSDIFHNASKVSLAKKTACLTFVTSKAQIQSLKRER